MKKQNNYFFFHKAKFKKQLKIFIFLANLSLKCISMSHCSVVCVRFNKSVWFVIVKTISTESSTTSIQNLISFLWDCLSLQYFRHFRSEIQVAKCVDPLYATVKENLQLW